MITIKKAKARAILDTRHPEAYDILHLIMEGNIHSKRDPGRSELSGLKI